MSTHAELKESTRYVEAGTVIEFPQGTSCRLYSLVELQPCSKERREILETLRNAYDMFGKGSLWAVIQLAGKFRIIDPANLRIIKQRQALNNCEAVTTFLTCIRIFLELLIFYLVGYMGAMQYHAQWLKRNTGNPKTYYGTFRWHRQVEDRLQAMENKLYGYPKTDF